MLKYRFVWVIQRSNHTKSSTTTFYAYQTGHHDLHMVTEEEVCNQVNFEL